MNDITQASMAEASGQLQESMSLVMAKKSLDFQAAMASNLISGSLQKSAEMRDGGLAAMGLGARLNMVI